jgi:hypothetical protein
MVWSCKKNGEDNRHYNLNLMEGGMWVIPEQDMRRRERGNSCQEFQEERLWVERRHQRLHPSTCIKQTLLVEEDMNEMVNMFGH